MRFWKTWWARLKPEPMTISTGERLRSGLAALAAVFLTAWLGHFLVGEAPLLVAAIGASSVLLFALPSGPLSQPWPVLGSYAVSGVVGVTCARFVPDLALASALAVSLSILGMLWLRCVHPPGGAVALNAVIGGAAVHSLGYRYVLVPALTNGLLLVGSALIVNNLLPHRHYPRRPPEPEKPAAAPPTPLETLGLRHNDVEQALAQYDHLLDISGEDLDQIIALAESRAFRRGFGELTCADVMMPDAATVRAGDQPIEAWRQLRRHGRPVVAVVDEQGRLKGWVGISDFIDRAGARGPRDVRRRLARLILHNMARENKVASMMSPPPVIARTDMHIGELIPHFGREVSHPIPVVDAQQRYVGMISQAAMITALYRRRLAEAAPAMAQDGEPGAGSSA